MTQEWSFLGDWNDYDQTAGENYIKEAKEEAGRLVKPIKIIAVQDRDHHNQPIRKVNITKIFCLCKEIEGNFMPNDETDACNYFSLNNLPHLLLGRNTKEQITMCFDANNDPEWQPKFE